MTFDEYQQVVRDVRLPSANRDYVLLGLSGEVGELNSIFAKNIRDNTALDINTVVKEIGDVLWFISALSDDMGVSLEEVALRNAAKLTSRKARGVIGGSGDNR